MTDGMEQIPKWAMERAEVIADRFFHTAIPDTHVLTRMVAVALATVRRETIEQCAKVIEEGFDRGIARKQDTCGHGKFEWEDCGPCAAAAIRDLAGRK